MHTIWRDVAVAWRRLLATPAFTFFAVLTLALGITAITTAWVAVRSVAAPPPGVPDVHELITISHGAYGRAAMVTFSFPDFEDLRRRQTTMDDVAAFATGQQVLAVDGQSYISVGEIVSGDYFGMLRVNAALGRVLQPSDDLPGAPLVTVLSHDAWQRMFGGRPDVIGRIVMVGGHPFEVVGIAPGDFVGLFANGRFPAMSWVSLEAAQMFERPGLDRRRADRNSRWLYVRARPERGVDIERIAAEVASIGRQLDETVPIGAHINDPRFRTVPNVSRRWVARRSQDLLMDEAVSFTGPPFVVMLMSSVGLVLLAACTNLANLVMARGSVRREELAVRLALGARRWQLVIGCMAEVTIITLAGVVLALGITWSLVQLLGTPIDVRRGVVFAVQPVLDLGTIGISLAAALVALVVAGAVPGAVLTGRSAARALMTGVTPTVVTRWRVRRALIAGQAAVSIVLLMAAALSLGQVAARASIDPGVDLDRLAMAEVDLALQNYDDARMSRLVERVLDRLNRHPAITSAAASAGLPFGPLVPSGSARVDEAEAPVSVIAVTPAFFDTAGISVVYGTGLDRQVAQDGMPPVVIDTALALDLFGRTDVVGQQLEVRVRSIEGGEGQPERRTVVGVAEEAGDSLSRRRHALYLPLTVRPSSPLVFTARTSDDPARIAFEIRAALAAAEPHLGVSQAGSAAAVLAPSTSFEAVAATVSSTLGGIGLMVVLAGLYGVLSYLVSRRTREIGMRLALGATPTQVRRMMIREGLAPVVVGVALGGVVALLVRQVLATQVPFGASNQGLALLFCVPLLILLAAAVACYFPARRASRIDPAAALKQ